MLAVALMLDAVFGEPRVLWDRVPHPVVAIGRLIGALDKRLNRGANRRLKGVVALLIVLCATALPCVLVMALPYSSALEVLCAAILLAHRSLVDHVQAVATALQQSLAEGRIAVSRIVGRDPTTLDEAGVARAAIESAAENFSDGVAAPAFWFLVAGLPGIALYKAINTADSMIGHRTERHLAFGWASARLDDMVNWLPARLTGLVFLVVGGATDRWHAVAAEAPLHKSVNAGWPEAGLAHVLGVALAGPRMYPGGIIADDPFVNEDGKEDLGPDDIARAIGLLWRAWAALLGLAMILAFLTSLA